MWTQLMDEHLETNRRHWDELVPIHFKSAYYDVAAFKAGKSNLHSLEIEEVGNVAGKSMLHLQCHFGIDSLSWARLGASVTGADFSHEAISTAQRLVAETGIEARFIESALYSLPEILDEQFDIVFTSYGVLSWLPYIDSWANIVAHFLRPGGTFYIAELHPIGGMFDTSADELRVNESYFSSREPLRFDDDGSYADPEATLTNRTTYSWPHPVSEVATALIDAGLRIEFIHEFPYSIERWFPFMELGGDGYFHMPAGMPSIPLLYSIRANKPRP
jgi:2-polyprenyl-3-methyl-5-hydroxy-6-metoxy-1,4-benzoquinol methylase